jgi:hypothetical protein
MLSTEKKLGDLRPKIFFEPDELFCNFLQGLVPCNFLETPVFALQGLLQAVRAVNDFQGVGPLGAEPSLVNGMRFQAPDLCRFSILHRHPGAAAVIAKGAIR